MNPSERKARTHDKYVQRTYGLEEGEYALLLAQQDGRCAICMKRAVRRRLAVDHDHITKRVRGLLCYFCNKYLGIWEQDPIALHNLILYARDILEGLPQPGLPEVLPVAPAGRPVVPVHYRKV
jgi:hypothetical protein